MSSACSYALSISLQLASCLSGYRSHSARFSTRSLTMIRRPDRHARSIHFQ